MASMTIQYPDAQQARIVDALCAIGGWTSDLGVTRGAFAKQMVVDYVKKQVAIYERGVAQQQALASLPPVVAPDIV